MCEEKEVVEIEAEMRHPEAVGPELKLKDKPTVKKGEWKSLSRPIASTIQPPTQLTYVSRYIIDYNFAYRLYS